MKLSSHLFSQLLNAEVFFSIFMAQVQMNEFTSELAVYDDDGLRQSSF